MAKRDDKFRVFTEVSDDRAASRQCEWDDCAEDGTYRAPRSSNALRSYRWFCGEHIRDYNKSWNYCADMTEEEVERNIRSDSTWNRPSWPMGSEPAEGAPRRRSGADGSFTFGGREIHDPFGLFNDFGPSRGRAMPAATAAEREALSILDLDGPINFETVKARYKVLVKRHHPDANGGDKAAEETFKRINQAYQTVMSCLSD